MAYRWLVMLTLLTCCSGCTYFQHPLVDPETAELPTELMGEYRLSDSNQQTQTLVSLSPASSRFPAGFFELTALELNLSTNAVVKSSRQTVFAWKLGDDYLLHSPFDGETLTTSAFAKQDESWNRTRVVGYSLMRVRRSENELIINIIDDKFIEAAIESGELQRAKPTASVTGNSATPATSSTANTKEVAFITSDSETLRAFVEKYLDKGLFQSEGVTLERISVAD